MTLFCSILHYFIEGHGVIILVCLVMTLLGMMEMKIIVTGSHSFPFELRHSSAFSLKFTVDQWAHRVVLVSAFGRAVLVLEQCKPKLRNWPSFCFLAF